MDQFLESLVAGTWPDEGGGDFLGVAEQGSGGGFVEKVRGRVVLDFRPVELVQPIGQTGDFFPEPRHDGTVNSRAQTPNARLGRGYVAEPFPEKGGMVDVVAELGEMKLGRAEMIGSLGLEEFGPYPVEYAGTLGDGGLLLVLRWHLSEVKLLFDQAPSLECVVVGKHVGNEVFQIESALLGLRVMAIHAIGFQQGKHVLVVSCQVSFWLSD